MADQVVERTHATVIVRNSSHRLLLLHFKNKITGKWRFPGGKIEVGETPIQSAARELKEETGLDALSLVLHSVHHQQVDSGNWRGLYFICDSYLGLPSVLENEKHSCFCWLTCDEILTADTPEPEKAIARLLKVL